MSKYKQRGNYHYGEFVRKTPYRFHIMDVLEKVKEFVPEGSRVLDYGCGEGLLVDKLCRRGFEALGFDTDKDAIEIGRKMANHVFLGGIKDVLNEAYSTVFCLDVLEHVAEEEFQPTVNRLLALAPLVFLAVPDRHDPHGVREFTMAGLLDLFSIGGWQCLHKATRNARHFVVMRRMDRHMDVAILDDLVSP